MLTAAFFQQSVIVYVGLALILLIWAMLNHTSFGLAVRAVGDEPRSADKAGIAVARTRWLAVLVAGFMASLLPDLHPTLENFRNAFESGTFGLYYVNTIIVVAGVLAVQCVTVSLAGYAFARLRFPGRDFLFYAFLLQLMPKPTRFLCFSLSCSMMGNSAGAAQPFSVRLPSRSRNGT